MASAPKTLAKSLFITLLENYPNRFSPTVFFRQAINQASGSSYTSGTITLNGHDLIFDTAGLAGLNIQSAINGSSNLIFTNSSNLATAATSLNFSETGFTGNFVITKNATLTYALNNAITNGTVNVLSGGNFNVTNSPSIAGLNGEAATFTSLTTSGKTLTLTGNGTYEYNGVIRNTNGASSLTMNAPGGTQILSGSNTYNGTTTVSAGTLTLNGTGGTLADAGNVTVSGGTLDVAKSDTVNVVTLSSGNITSSTGTGTLTGSSYSLTNTGTISAALGGSGTLAKSGAGTVTLSGNNTAYTGATTVNAGTLQSATAASLSNTSGITVTNAGSTLAVKYGGGSDYAAADVATLLGKTTFSSANTTFAFDTTNGNGTYGNPLAMNAGLTKLGANTLTLTAANTYNGSTTVGTSGGANAGTLSLSASGTISNNATTVYGGTLDVGTTTQQITTLTLGSGASGSTANVTIGTGGVLKLGGTVTYSNTNNPNGATISGPGTINLNGSRNFAVGHSTAAAADLTISAIIADGNTALSGVTKTGNGTWVLSGMNTYTGLTNTGSAGILSVSSIGNGNATSNVGASTSAGANLSIQGGTLQYTGANATTDRLIQIGANVISTLEASGTGAISFVNTGGISLSGNGTATHGLVLSGNNTGNNILTPYLSDAAGGALSTLTKTGVGTWVLAGNNTYTGNTTISAGRLQFAKQTSLYAGNNTLWTAANVIVANGGTLALNVGGGAGEFTTANVTTLLANLGGANGTSTAGFSASSKIAFDTTGGNFTVADIITNSTGSGGGSIGLVKLGSNTLTLSGNNTYSGNTTVNGGKLVLSDFYRSGQSGNVTLNEGTTLGISDGSGLGVAPSGVIFAGNSTLQLQRAGSVASGRRLEVGSGATATIDTQAFNYTINSTFTGTGGALTKIGSGNLTLNGNNTYTGATTVSSGTLLLNGSTAAGSAVTVNNSGTLGGNGTIYGSVNIKSGGTLAPGNSPGLLTVGSLVLDGGSTTAFEIAGTATRGGTYDAITVLSPGGLTLNGTFTINFTNATALANTTDINLFLSVGHTGDFSSLVSTGFYDSGGGSWSHGVGDVWTLSSGGQTLTFREGTGSLYVVPEPATWALLAFSLTTVMVLRRRRNS